MKEEPAVDTDSVHKPQLLDQGLMAITERRQHMNEAKTILMMQASLRFTRKGEMINV
jgi:hypothetical protein